MALLTINYRFTDTRQPINKSIKDIEQAYKSQQCNNHILPPHLLIIQKEVYPLLRKVVADVRPQEVVNGKGCQAKNVTVGWAWTADRGEEEVLRKGDYGAEKVEVEDGEGLERAVAEEVVNYSSLSVRCLKCRG